MQITKHGTKDPLYLGGMQYGERKLLFIGWSEGHVKYKARAWLRRQAVLQFTRNQNGG